MNRYKLTLSKKDISKQCQILSQEKEPGLITKITSSYFIYKSKEGKGKEEEEEEELKIDIKSFLEEVLKKEDLTKGKLIWVSFPDSINITILEEKKSI
jgi:hypothetical protein